MKKITDNVIQCLDVLKSTIFDYDDEKKKQFLMDNIEELSISIKTFNFNLSVLKFIGSNEFMSNLALSKMSSETIDVMLASICSNSIYSLSSYVSIMRKYLMETKETTETIEIGYMHIMSLKRKDLEKFIDKESEVKKYFTPEIIDSFVNTATNSNIGEYDYNTMTVIVMLWMGLTLDEIRNLKKYEVVVQDELAIIKTDRQEYVSKYFELFFLASIQKEYKMSDRQEIVEILYDDNSIFFVNAGITSRGSKGDTPISEPTLKKRIVNLAYQLKNKQLNVSNLTKSKAIYDMLEYFNFTKPTYTECHNYVLSNELKTNPEYMRRGALIVLNKLEEEKNR